MTANRIRTTIISGVGVLALVALTGILAACGASTQSAAQSTATPKAAQTTAAASTAQATAPAAGTETVNMVVKSDDEHGKMGSDGKWHDAMLPADFTVHAGDTVTVTVLNYDNSPHSFTSPDLDVNQVIKPGDENSPSTTTFTFTAAKAGSYTWHCDPACDPWAMSHDGFMRGVVTVI